jgi:hypothetical protein
LTANGSDHAEVAVGNDVTFHASATAPAGGGEIVTIEWDFDDRGEFAASERVTGAHVDVDASRRFDSPGTHFVTVRVVAQRDADATSPYARLQNVARVRVVVT